MSRLFPFTHPSALYVALRPAPTITKPPMDGAAQRTPEGFAPAAPGPTISHFRPADTKQQLPQPPLAGDVATSQLFEAGLSGENGWPGWLAANDSSGRSSAPIRRRIASFQIAHITAAGSNPNPNTALGAWQ